MGVDPGVPARVGALRDQHVDARGSGRARLGRRLAAVEDLRACGVGGADPGRGIAEARREHVDALVEDRLDRVGRLDLEDHVDAERPVRERADAPDARDDRVGRIARGAGHAEAAGVRDRSGELGRGDRPRARAEDRQLDAHQLADPRTHRHLRTTVRRHELPHHTGRRPSPQHRPGHRRAHDRARARLEAVAPAVRPRDHAAREGSPRRRLRPARHGRVGQAQTAATTSTSTRATSPSCSRSSGSRTSPWWAGRWGARSCCSTCSGAAPAWAGSCSINGPIKLARTDDDSFPWSMTEDVLEGYFSDMEQDWPSKERSSSRTRCTGRGPTS